MSAEYMRVPATRTEPSHLKKSLAFLRESLCHVSLSCHVRMRKGEKSEKGEKVKDEEKERKRGMEKMEKRERGRARNSAKREKKREKERDQQAASRRSCIPRSWKTHCLGCTHTGSGGCVASVKYRRSDSVE